MSSDENDKKGECRFLFFMPDKDFYKYKAHQVDDGLPMEASVFDRNRDINKDKLIEEIRKDYPEIIKGSIVKVIYVPEKIINIICK